MGHNNIVRFLGVLRADVDAGLVMEYVPRGNLFHLIHDPHQSAYAVASSLRARTHARWLRVGT